MLFFFLKKSWNLGILSNAGEPHPCVGHGYAYGLLPLSGIDFDLMEPWIHVSSSDLCGARLLAPRADEG